MLPIFAIRDMLPTAGDVLALAPEDLAGVVLAALAKDGAELVNRTAFLGSVTSGAFTPYPPADAKAVARALAEAWAWLERECLLVRDTNEADWHRISRRGRTVAEAAAFTAYRKASAFPRALLHPAVEREAWISFAAGKFDHAVFQAFLEVEIAVREAGGYDSRSYGVDMMRAAFHLERGPLTEKADPPAERESLSALFAGAIGSYKNPRSHRRLGRIGADEAGELLILASHLLRIVDDRRAGNAAVA